jgi:MerR family copper efflux transcriptional regulator
MSAADGHLHIGAVAERTGLSIRTIRHYEDVGLIVPSARSDGGFRLYVTSDVDRLAVVKRMKPLGFSLDEMRDLLDLLDALGRAQDGPERRLLRDRLAAFHHSAQERVRRLRDELATAEGFAEQIGALLVTHER